MMPAWRKRPVSVWLTAAEPPPLRFLDEADRTMDSFSKRVLMTAYRLFNGDFSSLDSRDTGAVISSASGPLSSIREIAGLLRNEDHCRINPSFFPNIMLSTALSHLTRVAGIHGPSSCFLEKDPAGKNAMQYASGQLATGNCGGMLYIRVEDDGWNEGRYLTSGRAAGEKRI